jgi:hypothetical protein
MKKKEKTFDKKTKQTLIAFHPIFSNDNVVPKLRTRKIGYNSLKD